MDEGEDNLVELVLGDGVGGGNVGDGFGEEIEEFGWETSDAILGGLFDGEEEFESLFAFEALGGIVVGDGGFLDPDESLGEVAGFGADFAGDIGGFEELDP